MNETLPRPESGWPEEAPNEDADILRPGQVFGAYEIVRELGSGGMGAVYEAIHTALRKRVALKVMRPEAVLNRESVARFLREGEAAARIRHEHVVDVTDVSHCDGVPFLVMEFLEGESLADLIDREKPLDARTVADLMLPVIAALIAAHDAGVIHRDLKPENIFIARDRRGARHPKVVDFGISRVGSPDDLAAQRLTSTSTMMGTPCYMSPEQARGARWVDAYSDQYSLGVVLYECATGELPFVRESVFATVSAILTEDPRPPREINPAVDPALEAVILQAMQRKREGRFRSMAALGHALLPLASPEVAAKWAPEMVAPPEPAATVPPPRKPAPSAPAPSVPVVKDASEPPVQLPTLPDGTRGDVPVAFDRTVVSAPPPAPRSTSLLWVAVGLSLLLGVTAVALLLLRPAPAGPVSAPTRPASTPTRPASAPTRVEPTPPRVANVPPRVANVPPRVEPSPTRVTSAPTRVRRRSAPTGASATPAATTPAPTTPWQIRTEF
ncbi:MAG: protein kinase [Polyangiales bacterium]